MFQRRRMFLKWGMVVGQRRVAGIAGLSGKTEIGHVQIPQFRHPATGVALSMKGMQRQQQENGQTCCGKQQKLYRSAHGLFRM
jgi:hypothetical protein